jgi:2-keto-4-pentenoate hydratase/2-oxohepta-3-ene-1,7-dioic acid hydratase in catechol pathway
VAVDSLDLVSPVTAPCRVVAQMTNYGSHVKGAGMDPNTVPLTFFRKASGSISGPFDEIIKPRHVKLLDYEVEVGLVIGRDIPLGAELTESNLADFIAGLVVTNDVSARDIQLTKTQFYEARNDSSAASIDNLAGTRGQLPEVPRRSTNRGTLGEQSGVPGYSGQLSTGADDKLALNASAVTLHRTGGDGQFLGDLGVGEA